MGEDAELEGLRAEVAALKREAGLVRRDLLVRARLEAELNLGILEIDPTTLEFFYNDAFAAMHDYNRHGYASNWAEASRLIHPDDHLPILDAIAGTDDFVMEYRLIGDPDAPRILHATGISIEGTEDHPEMRAMLIQDVTEAREREAALRQFDQQFQTIFETSPVGMSLLTADGYVLRANQAAAEQLGAVEVDDAFYAARVHPDDRPLFQQALARVRDESMTSYTYDGRYRHVDGHWVTLQLTLSKLGETSVGGVAYIAQHWDVTAQREAEARLQDEAERDPLTGLANRRVFQRELASRFDGQSDGALLLVDADQFKHHNDTYGHQTGDKILIGIAHALDERLRRDGVLARIGGDEFAIIVHDVDRDGAASIAAELVASMREVAYVISPDPERPITVSIGVAMFAETAVADDLFHLADQRLYAVKQSGRNGWSLGD